MRSPLGRLFELVSGEPRSRRNALLPEFVSRKPSQGVAPLPGRCRPLPPPLFTDSSRTAPAARRGLAAVPGSKRRFAARKARRLAVMRKPAFLQCRPCLEIAKRAAGVAAATRSTWARRSTSRRARPAARASGRRCPAATASTTRTRTTNEGHPASTRPKRPRGAVRRGRRFTLGRVALQSDQAAPA
jgi:hypothetical protein